MEKYVKQLVEDIRNAHRQLTKAETEKAETFEQHIAEVERYIAGEEDLLQQTFGYQCGLNKEQFPPPNRLTFEQMNTVCDAFEKLLFSWNTHADFPDELPIEMAYETLVSVLDRKFMTPTSGFTGLEFCDYLPAECRFKEHCTCKALFAEMDEEERKTEKQVQQLLKLLAVALEKIPSGTSFSSLHRLSLEDPKPIGELQVIAEWLNIPIDDFPPQHKLSAPQLEALCDALLAFWHSEDEMHIWLAAVNPSTRYRALIEFLKTKVWCTNKGTIILPPVDPEVLKNFKSPLDNLNLRDTLDFSEDDFEDDLPF